MTLKAARMNPIPGKLSYAIAVLWVLLMLSACGDRNEKQSSPGPIRQYADSYKDKARSVEDELRRSAESRRETLTESSGESPR